ncbi:MAG: hypothetical protein LIO79_01575 [Rikenellaceae bacterium]|nr:hypothetical protein [Rikenellaceae bacterium]
MYLRDKLVELGSKSGDPCVTISLNTHRIFPDTDKDKINLKNLIVQAEKEIIEKYGKRGGADILKKLKDIPDSYDYSYSLDSLHIFLSSDTDEIIRLPWPTHADKITIGDRFDIRTLLKAYNRTEEYYILVLSQGGVHLYKALNDAILTEVQNKDFPFGPTPYYTTNNVQRSDSKLLDDLVKEYFNVVDKAMVKIYRETGLNCVTIATEDNFSRFIDIVDVPQMYIGQAPIDYNHVKEHEIVKQVWPIVENLQSIRRLAAILEAKEAVGLKKILTNLNEIYSAAKDGNGDTLIVYEDYEQPVRINEGKLELVDKKDESTENDITSIIAWEVISKGGNAFFTCWDEIKDLGEIVLQTRY